MSLGKCGPCLDKAITDGNLGLAGPAEVPDAVVLVTVVQQFPVGGGQQLAAPCLIGVCLDCRKQQLGTVSKTGLLTA
jgi:hypothetical protein